MRYMRQFHWAGSWLVERVVEIGIGILEDVTRMEGESISKGRSRSENLKLLAPFSTNNFPRIRLDRGLRIEGSMFLRLGTGEGKARRGAAINATLVSDSWLIYACIMVERWQIRVHYQRGSK